MLLISSGEKLMLLISPLLRRAFAPSGKFHCVSSWVIPLRRNTVQNNTKIKMASMCFIFTVFLLQVMAVNGVPRAVCCIQVDIVDALRYLDNVQYLDRGRWTSRGTEVVQLSAM